MATVDDMPFESITEMTRDQALELIRQIRLNRRTPAKKTKSTRPSKSTKAIQTEQSIESLIDQIKSSGNASDLLKLIGG